jgi:Spy/CpxP family protein refolding chaperone
MKIASMLVSSMIAASLAAASGLALSQGGPPPGAGPGMMGGYGGHGMMAGYGGPGMMGGYGNPGMMGGYGNPGMMGGYGGPGYGPGWGGGGAVSALDLTDDQRTKLAALREKARVRNWDTMGKVHAEQYRLREMLRADTVNANTVADQQQKVDELHRQMLKSRLEARNEMVAVLTPEQRKRLRELGSSWYEGVDP